MATRRNMPSPFMARAADVVVNTRLRPLDQDRVVALAESMNAIGLQQPISVHSDGGRYDSQGKVVLVAGNHRLAAAIHLGWEEIPATYVDLNDVDRQLWEIDENLQRANLTPAQEADHLKRRAELWEARNKGGKTSPTPGGEQKVGFASDTAKTTGKSKRSINQAIHRAEKIAPDVMEAVTGTDLDKGVELDALAKMDSEEQRAAIAKVESGETDTVREKKTPSEAWLFGLQNTYRQATKKARRDFWKWILDDTVNPGEGDALMKVLWAREGREWKAIQQVLRELDVPGTQPPKKKTKRRRAPRRDLKLIP